MRLLILQSVLCCCLLASAAEATVQLELKSGQRYDCAFRQVRDSQLIFKTNGGASYTVSLDALTDRSKKQVSSWVRAQGGTLKYASWIKSPDSAFSKSWPKTVYGPANPPLKVRHDLSKNGKYVFETENYQFICDAKLDSKVVQRFSVLFETTHRYNMALPINVAARYEVKGHKFPIYLFESMQLYVRAGGHPRAAGVFIPSKGICLIPLQSLGVRKQGTRWIYEKGKDNSTISHELTHQLMAGTSFAPWFLEGSAEYVSSTPYNHAVFHVYNSKPKVIDLVTDDKLKPGEYGRMLGRRFSMPKLSRFMTMPYGQFAGPNANLNYGAALLLTYYFYHEDGNGDAARIKSYIKTLQRGGSEQEALKALLNGRSFEELEKSFAKYYAQSGVTIDFK
ncbi:hypothetical protein SAMN02745181_0789 [Rubritalea squalenifaciens DSM 18772]|uniref:Peptidase MA superfamily protein n=1 Tax=Rubritalea squalenifaciens DSM 18772 TaxID=1123071 RepID=A0A1M6DN76_9BACT|nr:hypothetical protein [Rubritalea squalenifaciens]SHI74652.1 hypothetical protein SAMN02745181_0789 [Rubritalea squalenifaciens DSM 18772]